MLRIGAFSTIARVSTVLLRHYDEMGLLAPAHVDPSNGYRYYSVEQLPRLNRILALKELGFSLAQISELLRDGIGPDELRGMLKLKQAQLEHELAGSAAQLRRVRARLKDLRQQGVIDEHDVVIKEVPTQNYLSIRERVFSQQKMSLLYRQVTEAVLRERPGGVGYGMALFHDPAFRDRDIDWELGFLMSGDSVDSLPLDAERSLTLAPLPGAPEMATVVHRGAWPELHLGFSAIGAWLEANRYRIAGESREVYLNLVPPEQEDELVVEVQIPVARQSGGHHV